MMISKIDEDLRRCYKTPILFIYVSLKLSLYFVSWNNWQWLEIEYGTSVSLG